MTIHSEHPFLPPPQDRDPLRRLRSHLPAPVSVWTSSDGTRRDGWTISSMLVADGDPGELVALVNEDSDWWDLFRETGVATVNVLAAHQGAVSEAFARLAPSPGGPFRTGTWTDAPAGPRLENAFAWVTAVLSDPHPPHAGWGLLVRCTIDSIDWGQADAPLGYRAGRYF